MKLYPIVALVPTDVIEEIGRLATTFPRALTEDQRASGWTIEMVMAGACLMAWHQFKTDPELDSRTG